MKSKKIIVLCPFPEGVAAGQRLKYEQYFDYWREQGYEISVSNFMDDSLWNIVYTHGNFILKFYGTIRGYVRRVFILLRLKKFDLVYIFMWVTPIGSSFFERMVRLLSKKIIFDVEDNVLMEKSNSLNPFMKLLKANSKTHYLIKNADHVITSSPYLNEYCSKVNLKNRCTYISSSVDTSRFLPVNRYNNESIVTVGWTGTFSSKVYLELLNEVFIELARRCNFKLRVIGNFEYSLPGVNLEVIQWSKDNEVIDLQGVDIGIYPLTDNQWVLGKSGLKAIQYMAFGLPTVASNVGTTKKIIQHKKNGWLVDSDSEWVDALEILINDAKMRSKIGRNARKSVLDNYSQEVIKIKYIEILNKLMESSNE